MVDNTSVTFSFKLNADVLYQPILVMDKDVWNTMDLGVEAAGGLAQGEGNPLEAQCGCLLSVASMVDGRTFPVFSTGIIDYGKNSVLANERTGIYAPPKENENALTELYRIFGMPPDAPLPGRVYKKNDAVCGMRGSSTFPPLSWSQFCKQYNIVPSL